MTADEWNERHRIGTPVRYSSILPLPADMDPVDTFTRSSAWTLGSGHAVVKVRGIVGGVHLTHLEVFDQPPPKETP